MYRQTKVRAGTQGVAVYVLSAALVASGRRPQPALQDAHSRVFQTFSRVPAHEHIDNARIPAATGRAKVVSNNLGNFFFFFF